MLSKADKAWLAEFAGGTRVFYKKLHVFWEFPDGSRMDVHRWSPDTNPAHGDLVLRALVEKSGGWFYVLRLLSSKAFGHEDTFDFLLAVCQTAIETRKD